MNKEDIIKIFNRKIKHNVKDIVIVILDKQLTTGVIEGINKVHFNDKFQEITYNIKFKSAVYIYESDEILQPSPELLELIMQYDSIYDQLKENKR